jgi:drug/metabolite transporter (DMT)-like permease
VDVALALAAALLFALGIVLQQQVAETASDDEAEAAGFLLRLARRPRWLAGVAADALGFVCQAAALAAGRLVVVQPLLASSLVFSLPLGAALNRRRIRPRALVAAAAVTAGLAAFLVLADPSGGREDPTARAWIASFALAAAACLALVLVARGRAPGPRAALTGAAAGILFGLAAGLTKATVERLDEGVTAVLGDWHVYALIAVGYAAMTLSQRSLQAGVLAPAVATQTTLDPLASLLLGTLAFDETIHESTLGIVGALAGLAVMVVGVAYLATATAEGAPGRSARGRPPARHAPRRSSRSR